MAERRPDWNRLRRIYASPNRPQQAPSASEIDPELAADLAEERAAIMEYDGGLRREEAEAYAFQTVRTN